MSIKSWWDGVKKEAEEKRSDEEKCGADFVASEVFRAGRLADKKERDAIALEALKGILINPHYVLWTSESKSGLAYRLADCMIRESKK